jgi:hypothetical protein
LQVDLHLSPPKSRCDYGCGIAFNPPDPSVRS